MTLTADQVDQAAVALKARKDAIELKATFQGASSIFLAVRDRDLSSRVVTPVSFSDIEALLTARIKDQEAILDNLGVTYT